MMSLQEMSDRLEIQDLMARYSFAIDERDYDALDKVFLPDSTIDYSEVGGAVGNLAETKAYLASAMKQFPGFQHASTTTKLQLDGDTAKASTILFNPMIAEIEGKRHVFFVGLWYDDDLVRTEQGWRIRTRRERASWHYNAPPGMMPED